MRFDIMGINILSAALGSYAIYYFCHINYSMKANKTKLICFIAVFGIINGVISSYLIQKGDLANTIKPIVLFFTSIFIVKTFFKTKFYQPAISFLIYSLFVALGNALIPLFINISAGEFTTINMINNPIYLFTVNILCNLIAYIIIITARPIKTFISKMLVQKITLPILLITFLILTAISGMYFYIKIFNLTAFFIISTLSILYCLYVILVSINIIKQEATKMEIDQQKFYNESLNSTILSLRRLKHDWNNNLAVINSMLHMNKIQELKAYLSELIQQDLVGLNTDVYNIKNAGLFGIISSKLNEAREKGITVDFSVSGEVEDIPEIKISELCEIIGIFIDNAIEEVINGDKSITTSIYNDDANLEITISNSCTNERDIEMINKAGHSSKGEGRGLGLAIVKQIISKYKNIQHVTDFEDNIFSQTITIEKGS